MKIINYVIHIIVRYCSLWQQFFVLLNKLFKAKFLVMTFFGSPCKTSNNLPDNLRSSSSFNSIKTK